MIGNSDLPGSHYLLQQNDVIHNAAGQSPHRNLIRAGIHISGNPFLLQSPGLCQQIRHSSGAAVRSQTAHYCSDTTQRNIRKHNLRRPAFGPTLSAASQNVHMGVNQPRHQYFATAIQHGHLICRLRRKLIRDLRISPPPTSTSLTPKSSGA